MPASYWRSPRLVGLCLALAISVAACSGRLESIVFTEPSTIKYSLTVILPVVAAFLLSARNPVLIIAVSAILVAPFSYVTTVAGIPIAAVEPVLILGVVVAFLSHGETGRAGSSRLYFGVSALIVALIVPVAESSRPTAALHILAVGVAMGYVVANAARRPRGGRVLITAVIVSAGVQAALATWEFTTGHHLNLYAGSGSSGYAANYFYAFDSVNRASGALPDPIALGNVLALAAPLTFCAALSAKRGAQRTAFMVLGLLLVVGLVATLSRMSWIGAVAGTIVVLFFIPRRRAISAAGALVIIMSLAVAAAIGFGGKPFLQRLQSIANPTASSVKTAQSDKTRLELQRTALDVGEQHPIAGVGLGDLPPYLVARVPGAELSGHAHDTYLNLFAETGAIGLGGVALVFIGAVADGRRRRVMDRIVVAGLFGSLVALLLVWTTDYTIREEPVMALMVVPLGILAGLRSSETPMLRAHPRPLVVANSV
jgi:O-Antigen ligase